MVITLDMKNELDGKEVVDWLFARGVTMWRIHKELPVSYKTVQAWRGGWWRPSYANTMKLYALKIKIEKE